MVSLGFILHAICSLSFNKSIMTYHHCGIITYSEPSIHHHSFFPSPKPLAYTDLFTLHTFANMLAFTDNNKSLSHPNMGFCGFSAVKSPPAMQQMWVCRFDPSVRKIPWRRKWKPPLVSLPGKSHGQRNLAGYSPWGHKELDSKSTHAHTPVMPTCLMLS